MIAGKKLTLGDKEFIVPPVPFAAVREHTDIFEGRVQPTTVQMGDIIYAAVHRNYPDMTKDDFEANHLDISNMTEVFTAVMTVSGAEAKPSGEAVPGNP